MRKLPLTLAFWNTAVCRLPLEAGTTVPGQRNDEGRSSFGSRLQSFMVGKAPMEADTWDRGTSYHSGPGSRDGQAGTFFMS